MFIDTQIMGKKQEFIIVGRTSEAIAQAIVDRYGSGERNKDGNPAITKVGKVIQSRVGTYEDGEASAALFVNGKTADHPIDQTLTERQKQKIARDLRGANVTIVLSASGINTSSRALSLLFLASALKSDYGVHKIKVVAPGLGFLRSDRKFEKTAEDGSIIPEFNAVACKEYAKLLKFSGVDELIGFEPHSRAAVKHFQDAFGKKNVSFINMGYFFADAIQTQYPLVDQEGKPLVMVGSPDGMNKENDFGIARAMSFGEALYANTKLDGCKKRANFRKLPYMFGIHKERISPNETKIVDFYGDVNGKICILIDDIVSKGSTMLIAAEELKKRGALKVIGVATHGVVPGKSLDDILKSPHLDQLMLTDTIPGLIDKMGARKRKKFTLRTVVPLVLNAIGPI